jgi:hypothetical protein
MKTLDTYDVKFPTWALCAIVNDDNTGLTVTEIVMIEEFKTEFYHVAQCAAMTAFDTTKITGFCIYDYKSEESFCKLPEFGLPCNCVDMTVQIVA